MRSHLWIVPLFGTVLALLGAGLLLTLAGCGTVPPVATSPVLDAPAGEDDPPPALAAYVPPRSQEPWPTALPEPTATPQPTLAEGRVVPGWGNFPRLPAVALASDGQALALYLVQGDTAQQLVALADTNRNSDWVVARLSPGGRYVACQIYYGNDGRVTIEVVDTQAPQRIVLFQSNLDATAPGDGKGNSPLADRLTSMAWLDDEHILYTVQAPNNCAAGEPPAGSSCQIPGELWVTDLNGERQRLLAADRLAEVLGASPDGQRAYFLRLGAEWVPAGPSEWYNLYSLDLTSGLTTTLWPQANDPDRYTGYTLLPFPDGGERVLFRNRSAGDTVATAPPVIWMLDPVSGVGAVDWTINQGNTPKGSTVYDTPAAYLWSPRSSTDFIYLADGSALGGIWWVDLASQQSHLLRQEGGDLLAWTAEGIVVHVRDYAQGLDILRLVDEAGQVQGEIQFAP